MAERFPENHRNLKKDLTFLKKELYCLCETNKKQMLKKVFCCEGSPVAHRWFADGLPIPLVLTNQ